MALDRSRAALVIVATAVLVLAADSAFAQCAMCRRALQSPEGQRMIAAFQDGILILLAVPFALFGTIATMAVRAQRRRSRQT
jgi:hypothetical protein